MGLVTVKEIFGNAWGVVEHRRKEIESGHYGAFDKIYAEEFAKNFVSAGNAGDLMGVCEGTARKWLKDLDARFVVEGGGVSYYRQDVVSAKERRNQHYAALKIKAETKKQSKKKEK